MRELVWTWVAATVIGLVLMVGGPFVGRPHPLLMVSAAAASVAVFVGGTIAARRGLRTAPESAFYMGGVVLNLFLALCAFYATIAFSFLAHRLLRG